MDAREKIVKIAKNFIGTPYKRGADFSGKPDFFDCSSFIQYIFKQINVELPRSSILQAACGKEISLLQEQNHQPKFLLRKNLGWFYFVRPIPNFIVDWSLNNDFKNLEIGDLLFMKSDQGYYNDEIFNGRKIYIGHVAIYIGDGNIIHSRKKLGGVIEQKIEELVKEPKYEIVLIKRIL